jgi:cell division protein FtsB
MLVALFLLVALLTAPVIPAETPVIELFPPSRPLAYTEDYTIYLYPDYEHSSCPNMTDVDVILGSALDMALIIHREAMMRFVGEFGFKYDKLLMLKFEKTTDKKKGMPIYVKELEPPVAGYFGGRGDYREVVIDCDVAKAPLNQRLQVIMHELYHSLGLGHPFTHNDYELMSYSDVPYPSSLDVAGVWELWFGKYASSSVEKVNFTIVDIPYVLLEPYNVTITRLVEQSRELEDRNKRLTSENFDLRRDIVKLRDEVSSYKAQVQSLEGQLEEKSQTISRLNETVSSLRKSLEAREATIGSLNKTINNLKAELASASARISSLESQVEKLESLKASLENENELLRARITNLQWMLLVLIVTFVCTAVSLAVVWRLRKK